MKIQKSEYVIAFYTFQEGLRNRLFTMTAIGLVCLFGLTEFIGDLSITEARQIQASLAGSIMRLFAVVTVILFVLTSMTREINDKGLELILAMPLKRSSYYLGKFIGHYGLAVVIIMLAALLLLLYAEPVDVMAWGFSLICEIGVLIALSMLCQFTFSNVTVSFVVAMAFYLLARSNAAIQLVSGNPLLEIDTLSQDFMKLLLDGIALVMPDMADYTRSEWLVYGFEPAALYRVIVQTVIYMPLLLAAGLFDLYRKDL